MCRVLCRFSMGSLGLVPPRLKGLKEGFSRSGCQASGCKRLDVRALESCLANQIPSPKGCGKRSIPVHRSCLCLIPSPLL